MAGATTPQQQTVAALEHAIREASVANRLPTRTGVIIGALYAPEKRIDARRALAGRSGTGARVDCRCTLIPAVSKP